MANVKVTDLYDLSHTLAAEYLSGYTYPWEALAGIKDIILEIGSKHGSKCQGIKRLYNGANGKGTQSKRIRATWK